jgi:selenocysteine-specific elongation factor
VPVLATAGHVDHGKSTLVRALTGTDPDRFEEEKRRGLTIDLGFAELVLEDGRLVSFVDVPGHVRFLRNMLAGVGGVDGCLFVVAATEGWKPQSEEHLRILDLLGVEHGIVALTKVGLADEELTELARLDVEDHVKGSFLEGSPVVEVDAVEERGLPELRAALAGLLDRAPGAPDRARPRLWIDRVFAARGAGTIVTGTLTGGTLAVDDPVLVEPHHLGARVRNIQTHGRDLDRVGPGHRVALNLAGVAHGDLRRGDVVVRPGEWFLTDRLDAELTVLPALDDEISRRGAWHVHVGSGDHVASLRVLGAETIAPGSRAPVRLHLPVSLPLTPGDRLLVREAGRDQTVGGAVVLDVDPVLPAARAVPDRDVARVVRERGVVEADLLRRLVGEEVAPNLGRWVVDPDHLAALRDDLGRRVDDAGPLGLELATLDPIERAALGTVEGVAVEAEHARRAGAADPLAGHPFPVALAASPFEPPGPDGVAPAELRELVRRGAVVESEGIYFAPEAIGAAGAEIARLLEGSPGGVTVAQIRDALGTTRKYLLPLLAHLDRTGVTRRRDDLRIGGPRLPGPG